MEQNTKPILIVDDDSFQRRMIRIKLQTRGYEVNEARDGTEALGFIAEQDYSMILLDIVMPRLNGWEVLDQIRAGDVNSDVVVVMMTAKDNNYDPEAAKKRGATDYLTKPIDFAALDARIDEYIASREANKAPQEPVTTDQTENPIENKAAENAPAREESPPISVKKPIVSRQQQAQSLLDGMMQNLPGVFFRAICDAENNVHMSYESSGINDFLGQSWDNVPAIFASLEDHDRREVNRQFRSHGKELKAILLRFPCHTDAGRIGWVECRATPHRLPSGETVWDAMLQDVTKQKELELRLIRAREAAHANPAPEHLPLLEMYRRYYAAVIAGQATDGLAENILELERDLAEALQKDDDKPRGTVPRLDMGELPDTEYRDKSGYIHQCAQCRRVQNFSNDGKWEMVTDWVHGMPLKTNHTVCADCVDAEASLTSN
ncbi:MAG: response regulator [Gammaproteobacteria bacterium]|nr:response regulator [Gammaproteobacteria bacterium]